MAYLNLSILGWNPRRCNAYQNSGHKNHIALQNRTSNKEHTEWESVPKREGKRRIRNQEKTLCE